MKKEGEIETFLRKECSEYVCKMSSALAFGEINKFDFYYSIYQTARESLHRRVPDVALQMDSVVLKLYELRRTK